MGMIELLVLSTAFKADVSVKTESWVRFPGVPAKIIIELFNSSFNFTLISRVNIFQ